MKAALAERGRRKVCVGSSTFGVWLLPFWWGWCVLFGGMGAVAAEMDGHADVADPVVLGEEDLADRAEILRNRYRRMTPGDAPLVQDVGTWPAAWEEFSPVWDGAAAERDLGTWTVPVEAERDGSDTVLRDGNWVELWRGRTDFSKDGTEGVVLTGALVAEEDWPLYRAARGEIARRLAAIRQDDGGGLRGTNGPCTNGLHFVLAEGNFATNPPELRVGIVWTNSAMVDVFAYGPLHTSETHVVTYTNDENEVVTWTNTTWHSLEPTLTGFGNAWEWLGTVAVSNAGINVFVDNNFPTNRGIVRYYAAAEAVDSDGDGLNDGMEAFVWHTDPLIADSDGDSWGDGMEVAVGYDPTDEESVPNVLIHAVFYNPEGHDTGKEWLELYSASSTDVDLGGFQIEVGHDGVWATAVTFATGTIVQPGRCLLVGESLVTNADVTTDLNITNAWGTIPTTGIRLSWLGATNGYVADVVFIGGGAPFNQANLDTTGWLSETSLWARADMVVERRFPGLDTDRAEDWKISAWRTGQNVGVALDFDGDGLTDTEEWTGTSNPWGEPTNPWNADSDGDGLDDFAECTTHETNPNTWFTDGDVWPWAPSGTLATNWPGSDFHELAFGWNPHGADENTNGIPDSWEVVMGLENLLNGVDSDGDGVSDLDELMQNSNPMDPADFTGRTHLLVYEASQPGWKNGVATNDIGLGGHVKVHYLGLKHPMESCVWVEEGMEPEEFEMKWESAVRVIEAGGRFSESGRASAIVTSGSVLCIEDKQSHPEFDEEYLGGEYAIAEHSLAYEVTTAGTSLPEDRTTLGACETVHVYLDPSPGTEPTWDANSGYFQVIEGDYCYHACDTAAAAVLTATYDEYTYTQEFTVISPSGVLYEKCREWTIPSGTAGAGMDAYVTILPTNVSFANLLFREGVVNPSEVTGYFVGRAPEHKPNLVWEGVWDANMASSADQCYATNLPAPWSDGHFQWDIPQLYKDASEHYTDIHTFTTAIQHTFIESDGTVEVRKGNAVVRRSP